MDMDMESVVQHASYSIRASCTSLASDTPGFEALGRDSHALRLLRRWGMRWGDWFGNLTRRWKSVRGEGF